MKFQKLNLFAVWFFVPVTFVLGWVAFAGRMLLELVGISTPEGSLPGIIVGLLLIFAVVFIIQHLRGALWPLGNSEGNGYRLGLRLLLAANVLALLILAFRLGGHLIVNHDLLLIVDRFTDAFGYWAMGMWAIGLSFVYQSTLSSKVQA
ncbi:MAG: hypothetical protein Q8O24_09960 [Gallionellaceae bacterium]|nr:hypothetical protein [Gallionellaceae bacterium]